MSVLKGDPGIFAVPMHAGEVPAAETGTAGIPQRVFNALMRNDRKKHSGS